PGSRGRGGRGPLDGPIQDVLHGGVAFEGALEEVVEVLPVGGYDDQLTRPARPLVERPHAPDQLVERALAAAVAECLGPAEDLDGRDGGIVPQPLRDMSRVLRHDRRAPGLGRFCAATHARFPSQIRYRDDTPNGFRGFRRWVARPAGASLTGQCILLTAPPAGAQYRANLEHIPNLRVAGGPIH